MLGHSSPRAVPLVHTLRVIAGRARTGAAPIHFCFRRRGPPGQPCLASVVRHWHSSSQRPAQQPTNHEACCRVIAPAPAGQVGTAAAARPLITPTLYSKAAGGLILLPGSCLIPAGIKQPRGIRSFAHIVPPESQPILLGTLSVVVCVCWSV